MGGKKGSRRSLEGKQQKKNPKLETHIRTVVNQPPAIWGEAIDQALMELSWPGGINSDLTFLCSIATPEQAEVLVQAGYDQRKVSAVVAQELGIAGEAAPVLTLDPELAVPGILEHLALNWLDSLCTAPEAALGIAGMLWKLPLHAAESESAWIGQWLEALVEAIDSVDLMRGHFDDLPILNPLVLHCEAPLFIAWATAAPPKRAQSEASRAMNNLAELLESAEADLASWLLHGASCLRAALASVLRCRVLANALGMRSWYGPQRKALAALLREVARWGRHDGTQLLLASRKPPRHKRVWEQLANLAKVNRATAAAMAGSGLIQRAGATRLPENTLAIKLGLPSVYSESAELACMRVDWSHKSGRVAVDFSDTDVRIEVRGPKGDALLGGVWDCHVRRDQQRLPRVDGWAEVCWFSDDNVDYLELETQLDATVRVQRQIMLMRDERLLFLADALLGDAEADWSVHSTLPLSAAVRWEPAERNTEGQLLTPHGSCYMVPLFLPEWKRELALQGNWAHLERGDDGLTIGANRRGRALYTPIVISLNSRHARRQLTWRRLTVGRDLQIVPPDEAVAYRLQIGEEQWLFYRSLGPVARRTALGVHTTDDFFAARFFGDDGTIDTLIQIQTDD